MSEDEKTNSEEAVKQSKLEKLQIENREAFLKTLLFIFIGTLLFVVLKSIPMPYLAVGLFKFGLVPALAIISTIAAIRGPLAGLLTGYIGSVLANLLLSGGIVAFTLYSLAYGVMGFIVGLARYDFNYSRSLAKLSVLSMAGLVITVLLIAVVGLFVEGVATLVVIGFQLLPLLTMGLPSVFLLTPLFAWLWHQSSLKMTPEATA
jgi:energy-coupling factor transport system substrate-specific component